MGYMRWLKVTILSTDSLDLLLKWV